MPRGRRVPESVRGGPVAEVRRDASQISPSAYSQSHYTLDAILKGPQFVLAVAAAAAAAAEIEIQLCRHPRA